ncbi:HalOD1 output domain-containing protein [Natrialbaceae archaeon A-CW2]|uniref:HalOD1 output domain-containing protein n=1 Tax=Natronosalvus amylolyticus TaxID=2961994 RepID=UPI0020C9A6FE|nr:HalOD1 output domain-containing protein [Natronosalvus amylolyticus]
MDHDLPDHSELDTAGHVTDGYRTRYDESPSGAVSRLLSVLYRDTRPPMLYDAIDPEALDTLFGAQPTRAARTLSFRCDAYVITVERGGSIFATPRPAESRVADDDVTTSSSFPIPSLYPRSEARDSATSNRRSRTDRISSGQSSAEPSLSMRVIQAVADRNGVDPLELSTPLYYSLDPEALDSVFQDTTGHLAFEYDGYTVTVDSGGAIDLDQLR